MDKAVTIIILCLFCFAVGCTQPAEPKRIIIDPIHIKMDLKISNAQTNNQASVQKR